MQLDDAMVAALDREAQRLGVSRSELIRRGAETILKALDELEKDRRHEQSYRDVPETDEERAWAQAALRIAAETWPEW